MSHPPSFYSSSSSAASTILESVSPSRYGSVPPSPSPSPPPDRSPSPTETSPLLTNATLTTSDPLPSPQSTHWTRWKVAYLYSIFILVITFGGGLGLAPSIRLLESAVCRKYYSQHDPSRVDGSGNVPEAECKVNVVQSELAMLRAWLSVLSGLVGILVAVPFGIMADSKGRRLVIAICAIGFTLSDAWVIFVCYFSGFLPPSAVLGSSLFMLLGGGTTVVNSVIMAALTDSTPPERRTAVFFYTSASTLVSELLATPLGAYIMTRTNPYTAGISAATLMFSSIFVLLLVPETLKHNSPTAQVIPNEADESDSDESSKSAGSRDEEDVMETRLDKPSILSKARELWSTVNEFVCRLNKLISRDRTILIALPAMLTSRLGRPTVLLLIQYVSKNLHWSLAEASILVSVRPAVNIFLFVLILPNLSKILARHFKIAVPNADLLVAQISAVVLVLGLLILGLGKSLVMLVTGLVVYTLGWGLGESLILYLTSRVDQSEVATLLSVVSVVSTVGSLAGDPILAKAFSKGMELEGLGSGLPFFVAMGTVVLVSSGMWSLRWR